MNQIEKAKAHRAKMFAVIEQFEEAQKKAVLTLSDSQGEAVAALESNFSKAMSDMEEKHVAAMDSLFTARQTATIEFKQLIIDEYGKPDDCEVSDWIAANPVDQEKQDSEQSGIAIKLAVEESE